MHARAADSLGGLGAAEATEASPGVGRIRASEPISAGAESVSLRALEAAFFSEPQCHPRDMLYTTNRVRSIRAPASDSLCLALPAGEYEVQARLV